MASAQQCMANYKEAVRRYGMKKNDKTGGTRGVVPADMIKYGDINWENKNTYRLLQISNSNAGIDGTLRTISGGEATTSVLQLSSSAVNIAAGALQYAGTAITATAAELNVLDGITATVSELNILGG